MALDILNHLEIIEVLENFIERKRPPIAVRHLLEISYRIEKQSVFIFEIRPRWNKPEEKMECTIAKATFVKTKNNWNVYLDAVRFKMAQLYSKTYSESAKRFY